MVRSPIPDVIIPNVAVHELAFELFRVHDKKVAIVDGASGRSFRFVDLLRMSRSVASALVRAGAQKGEVLAIHSPNTPEYPVMFLGAVAAGLTVTTINPAYTIYEVSKQLEDSGAAYLYTTQPSTALAQQAADKYGRIKKRFVLGQAQGFRSFSDLVRDDGKAYPFHLTYDPANDVVVIPYSSGTTGLPKGVQLTHRNIVSNFCQTRHDELRSDVITTFVDSGKQLTILGLLPFYHSYGMMVIMLYGMMQGYKVVTLTHFEPELFLSSVQKYKINQLILVPPLVIFVAKNPLVQKYDLSSVIVTGSGAAPLSKDTEAEACKINYMNLVPPVVIFLSKSPLVAKYDLRSVILVLSAAAPLSRDSEALACEALGITNVIQGYGLTETSPVATIVPRGQMGKKRGSVGIPLPNSEIQIVEVGGTKILGPDQTGEVWTRGPHIMKGYFNKPQATRDTIDSDGWLHTGDIGYYDRDGFFYIVDRIKELIKYKGFQVPPAELESLLLNHPAVADVGVIGIPDAEAGEVPKAFIVKKTGHQVTTVDIHKMVEEHLTSYKRLRGGVEFVDQIPKSPSGKIMRRELAKMHKGSKL